MFTLVDVCLIHLNTDISSTNNQLEEIEDPLDKEVHSDIIVDISRESNNMLRVYQLDKEIRIWNMSA